MKIITLPKNKTELDYFQFGEHTKMKIVILPSTSLPIKIKMKEVPSGREMVSYLEINKKETMLNVSEYNQIKISFPKSKKDQQIEIYFDSEII